jgi:hypothetical protein
MKLIDFLRTYNFREFDENEKHDSSIVRIVCSDNYSGRKWIDFGVYDFDDIVSSEDLIRLFLNSKILDSEVISIRPNYDAYVVEVMIDTEY